MGRLTWKTPDGVWGVKGVEWGEVPQALYGPLCKLKDYEDVCDSPRVAESYLDGDLGPVQYRLIDREHNVYQCGECGHIARFEADGPHENGWNTCPSCARMIADAPEEDDDEPA